MITRSRLTWIVFMAVVGVLGLAALLQPLFSTKVYAGVMLEGVDLGGKSREDVAQVLSLWQKREQTRKILMYYGDITFPLDGQSIDLDVDTKATLDEVWGVGRKGPWWERLKNIRTAMNEGYRIPLKIRYNESKLNQFVIQWEDSINQPAKNAALSLVSGGVLPQEPGRRLELEVLRPLIAQALRQPEVEAVPLPVSPVYPEVTVADIRQSGIRESYGTYSTVFNVDDANRSWNIKLAARKINGHMVYPGQTFSFNEVVGPRDKEHGFKEALEIVDGEFVPGIGGGICQVSSTLYNAVLLSNLAPVERFNHSKPLGYVPLGRDATVAYGALDFKFANTTSSPVMIMAEIQGNKLYVGVFGSEKPEETVEIVSAERHIIPPSIVKRQDAALFAGETTVDKKGKPGYEVTTVRVVRIAGREVKREVLSKDRYLPENTVVKVGTKIPPFVNTPSVQEATP